MRESKILPHAFAQHGAPTRGRSRSARIAALALAGVAMPLLAHVAGAAPADDISARLAAVEREVALLRQENAALRKRTRQQAQDQPVTRPLSPQPPSPPAGPYAAAVPVYKAAPAAPEAYGWTGVYVGANVGIGVARNPTGAPVLDPGVVTGVFNNEQLNLSPFGVIGGAQAGYNWQLAPNWVLGVETDVQGTSQIENRSCIDFCNVSSFGEGFTQSIDWFGTLRGRMGWTNGPTLFYVTGGGAYGQVTTDLGFMSNGAGLFAGKFVRIKTGWTVGAGIESQIAGNWTAKAEYLFMDLGTVSGGVPTSFGETFTFSSKVQDHIGRIGVNYKFGEPIYVSASGDGMFHKALPAGPMADWTGFYIGANMGAGVARSRSSETQTDPVFGRLSHDSFFTSPVGVIGGGQLGYNRQLTRRWAVGVEADFQGAGQRDTATCVFECSSLPAPLVSINETIRQDIDWFGTVRGRVGWTDGPWMLYGTGGFAYGRVSESVDSLWTNSAGLTVTSHGAVAGTKTGWTAGGGVEAKVAGNWSAKVEYLFVDLGTIAVSAVSAGNFAPQANRTFAVSSDVQDHIFRLGVNYQVR